MVAETVTISMYRYWGEAVDSLHVVLSDIGRSTKGCC